MDLKNIETTSTLAIEAVYRAYWDMIPDKYKLKEKPQRPRQGMYPLDMQEPNTKPYVQKSTPLTYKQVEQKEEPQKDDYEIYCDLLASEDKFDLQPFFDPQLDFENRLHYKLAGIGYPQRKNPWFIITWNCGYGILKSEISNRLFDTAAIKTPSGEQVKVDFINTQMDITLCFNSNDLQALFALQELIRVRQREKLVVYSPIHSIIGKFPVALDAIETGNIAKATRDKSTLCTLTLTVRIDYPVIGNIRTDHINIIREFHTEYDKPNGEGPDNHEVLARDIVKEEL